MSDEGDPKGPGRERGSDPDAKRADDDERARELVKKALGRARTKAPAEETAGTADPSKRSMGEGSPASVSGEDEPMSIVVDEVDLKDALRGALRPPEGSVAPKLLRGVQKKLRVRSKGKFYGDGWSTSESPKTTYLITTIIMLALVAILFFALIPWSTTSLP